MLLEKISVKKKLSTFSGLSDITQLFLSRANFFPKKIFQKELSLNNNELPYK